MTRPAARRASEAPSVSLAGRARVRGMLVAAVAALALVGLAELAGALDSLERASISTRFALRDAPPPADIVIVKIDDRTFGELNKPWPLSRSLHARVIDRLHAAGAREIVYDVQFTEPRTPAEDGDLYDAIGAAGNVTLATSQSDAQGRTNVLGGDANLAQVHARAAAANLTTSQGGVITHYPYEVSHLKSLAVVAAERASGKPLSPVALPRRQRADRLPRRRRYLPQRPVLAGASRGRARQRLPRQDRRGRRDGAEPSGLSCDADERQRSHAGPGGPGERDLDGLARQPADERARLAHRARDPRRRAAGPARRAAAGSDPGDDDRRRRRRRLRGCGEAGVRRRRRPRADRTARRLRARYRRTCWLRATSPPGREGRVLGWAVRTTHRAAARRAVRGHRATRAGRRVTRRRHRRAHPSHRRPLRAPRAARRLRTRAGAHAAPRERAPRRRQDRHPGQRPAQAGRTRPGRVAASCNRTPRRAPRSSRARPRRSSRWPRRSPAPTTSAGTAPATPTAWRARTSRSRAASAPSATSTTRWARSGRTRRPGRWQRVLEEIAQGSGSHFDPALVKAFLELAPELGRGARPEQLDDVDLDSLPPLFEEEAEDVSPGSRAPSGTRS